MDPKKLKTSAQKRKVLKPIENVLPTSEKKGCKPKSETKNAEKRTSKPTDKENAKNKPKVAGQQGNVNKNLFCPKLSSTIKKVHTPLISPNKKERRMTVQQGTSNTIANTKLEGARNMCGLKPNCLTRPKSLTPKLETKCAAAKTSTTRTTKSNTNNTKQPPVNIPEKIAQKINTMQVPNNISIKKTPIKSQTTKDSKTAVLRAPASLISKVRTVTEVNNIQCAIKAGNAIKLTATTSKTPSTCNVSEKSLKPTTVSTNIKPVTSISAGTKIASKCVSNTNNSSAPQQQTKITYLTPTKYKIKDEQNTNCATKTSNTNNFSAPQQQTKIRYLTPTKYKVKDEQNTNVTAKSDSSKPQTRTSFPKESVKTVVANPVSRKSNEPPKANSNKLAAISKSSNLSVPQTQMRVVSPQNGKKVPSCTPIKSALKKTPTITKTTSVNTKDIPKSIKAESVSKNASECKCITNGTTTASQQDTKVLVATEKVTKSTSEIQVKNSKTTASGCSQIIDTVEKKNAIISKKDEFCSNIITNVADEKNVASTTQASTTSQTIEIVKFKGVIISKRDDIEDNTNVNVATITEISNFQKVKIDKSKKTVISDNGNVQYITSNVTEKKSVKNTATTTVVKGAETATNEEFSTHTSLISKQRIKTEVENMQLAINSMGLNSPTGSSSTLEQFFSGEENAMKLELEHLERDTPLGLRMYTHTDTKKVEENKQTTLVEKNSLYNTGNDASNALARSEKGKFDTRKTKTSPHAMCSPIMKKVIIGIDNRLVLLTRDAYTNPFMFMRSCVVVLTPEFANFHYIKNNQVFIRRTELQPQYPIGRISPILPNNNVTNIIIHNPPSREGLLNTVACKRQAIQEKRLHQYEQKAFTADIFCLDYLEDIIHYFLSIEPKFVIKSDAILGINIIRVRAVVISWLYTLKIYFVQQPSIILKTIRLYDWIITHEILPINMHQLIAIVILMMLQKMDNSFECDMILTISYIRSICKGAYDTKTIARMEHKLLTYFKLTFDLPDSTTFLEYYCHACKFGANVIKPATLLLEIFSTNEYFSYSQPSCQAAASIYLILKTTSRHNFENCWPRMEKCSAFTSRTTFRPVSSLMMQQVKKMPFEFSLDDEPFTVLGVEVTCPVTIQVLMKIKSTTIIL